MKDPEIISVKAPQSQPKNEKKISSSDLLEDLSFEKKLKTSSKKLEQNDDELSGLINMLAQMSSIAANQKPEKGGFAAENVSFEKHIENSRLSDIANGLKVNAASREKQNQGQNNPSDNPLSSAGNGSKGDHQQILMEQLLAYFKSAGVPFPVMDLVSKLENLNAKPDIGEIAQKIIENANLIKVNGKTELVLNLKPQWLGELKMTISSDNGTLTIQIFANGRTKELIESQLEELKNLLAGANLNIGSLNVSVGGQNAGNSGTEKDPIKDTGISDTTASSIRKALPFEGTSAETDNIAMTMRRLMIYSEI